MGSLLTGTRARCGAIAVTLAGLVGCGSTDDESHDDEGVCSISNCPEQCDDLFVESCDVRDAACQADIFDSVRCVWGGTGTAPPTRVISESEYQANLEDPANQDPPEDPARSAAWEWTLLVRLVSARTITWSARRMFTCVVASPSAR